MREENFVLDRNEIDISCKKWYENFEPKAIIQISHGMAEHKERYEFFSKIMLENGYFVYANDHRGHGKSLNKNKDIGFFSEENGWEKVVEDMHQLTLKIKSDFPNKKIFLLGHSMGSFLTRRYAELYSNEISGIILSGTASGSNLLLNLGILIANYEIKKKGLKSPSSKLDKLSFGNYNKKFTPNRTKFDWLSRDEKSVDNYIKDPMCGFVCSAGFFKDLLNGLKEINKIHNISKISKDLPVIFLAGSKDPVGNFTKGVTEVYEKFIFNNIKDVSYKYYENARHELLNETNKEEIYKDIKNWINEHI